MNIKKPAIIHVLWTKIASCNSGTTCILACGWFRNFRNFRRSPFCDLVAFGVRNKSLFQ